MSKKMLKVAVAAMAVVSMQAHADLTIDKFTEGVQSITDTGAVDAVGVWSSTGTGLTTVLGGQRDVYVIKTSSTLDSKKVSLDVGGGFFDFSQDSNTSGTALVRWDGTNTATNIAKGGLGSVNLAAAGTGFSFQFKSDSAFIDPLSTPAVVPYIVTIEVWGTGGTKSNSITQTAYGTLGNYVTDSILFSEAGWSNAAFNFADVSALQISFNTGATQAIDVDISITNIGAVPEPGSLALAGLALLGLGAARRRKA